LLIQRGTRAKTMKNDPIKIVTKNRKASHNYFFEETVQAGLVLMGSEIKSIRAGHITLGDGYVKEVNGELWLYNVHINLYEMGASYGHKDPLRPRKLLLHRKEIARLIDQMRQSQYTLIPTMVFLQKGRAKVEVAVAKGKKEYDKRETISKRDAQRQIERALKGRDD
jgi:SsrA-binding protein